MSHPKLLKLKTDDTDLKDIHRLTIKKCYLFRSVASVKISVLSNIFRKFGMIHVCYFNSMLIFQIYFSFNFVTFWTITIFILVRHYYALLF